MQTDPRRRRRREPSDRGVPYSHISDTTGRFWPVSIYSRAYPSGVFGEAPTLDPASKLIKRRRSLETRPVLASPYHPRCLLSLRRSAAVISGSTLTASLRRLKMGDFGASARECASVASSGDLLSVRTEASYHRAKIPSRAPQDVDNTVS